MSTPNPQKSSSDGTSARRFGLHIRRSEEAAPSAQQQARERLLEAGCEVLSLQEILEGQRADALLSFGGDGTLLHAARLMAPLGIPVLGINLGRVGYLCAVEEHDLEHALERLIQGDYDLDRRSMLRARVFHDEELVWQADALNEFLVGGSNRALTLEILIDGEPLGTIRGDGVILSTLTGSTAHAFSAGGAVLLVDALLLVASNALFSSPIRSLVLPTSATFQIRNRTPVARPFVIADGQKDYQINQDTQVDVALSPDSALLVDLGLKSPVQSLRRGFHELKVREL